MNDLLLASVRGESVKPDESYARIEELVPEGHYLDIFARKFNIRPNYVTIGNQVK